MLFKEAYSTLANNGAICIFPEGTSHDRPEFIKLKAGIAFMALGAMAEYNCKPVKIIPVGLNYYEREKFRSMATIEFGKAFEIPIEWAQEFKTNKRMVTEKLLNEVESRMKSVTLYAPTINELRALIILRNCYIPKDAKITPTEESEICKRFIKGYDKLKDNEEVKSLLGESLDYIREIDEIAIKDKEVVSKNFDEKIMKKKFIYSTLTFFLYLLLVLPCFIIMIPFLYYIRTKAEKERLAAKAKNANKIEALDVVASVKVVSFLTCLPLIYIAWLILTFWYMGHYFDWLLPHGFFLRLIIYSICFPVYFYCKYNN